MSIIIPCAGRRKPVPPSALIAIDSEFEGAHTLTVQAAARLAPDTLAVQVYRAAAVPDLPTGFDVDPYLPPTPGMLRDVDMSGCYNRIVSRLTVYWGRPVIFEPGARAVTLKAAVEVAKEHADWDAWLIRASGPITTSPNALVPSTDDAAPRSITARRCGRAGGGGPTGGPSTWRPCATRARPRGGAAAGCTPGWSSPASSPPPPGS
jgi:hypothetical protein